MLIDCKTDNHVVLIKKIENTGFLTCIQAFLGIIKKRKMDTVLVTTYKTKCNMFSENQFHQYEIFTTD